MKRYLGIFLLTSCLGFSSSFTTTSPLNGGAALPSAVSSVGGVVLDVIGLNGSRLTAEQAANTLFIGNAPATNPSPVIGSQSGFTPSILSQLGGGFSQVAFRFTLYDGDTASGNFDYHQTTLDVNGVNFGDWSLVQAQNTDGMGNAASAGLSGGGFRDNTLDTGFFYSKDSASLKALYSSLLATGTATYGITDQTPGDQYYDFTQGLNASVVGVGTGPIVTPPPPPPPPHTSATPEPATYLFMASGLTILAMLSLRRRYKHSS